MKLGDISIIEPATRIVTMRVAGCATEFTVGLRLLSAREHTGVYSRAKAEAAKQGAQNWDQDDPVCALELYVETVAACTFDVDNPAGPWSTAEELREHGSIGQENLVFLYEAYVAFADENSVRAEKMGPAEFVQFCLDCTRGGNDFLDRLRPGTLRTCLRYLAAQFLNSLQSKSLDSTGTDLPTESIKTKPESS